MGIGQFTSPEAKNHIFVVNGEIDDININENSLPMMGAYHLYERLVVIIEQLNKGREFARAGGQTISDDMMVSKGIILLA